MLLSAKYSQVKRKRPDFDRLPPRAGGRGGAVGRAQTARPTHDATPYGRRALAQRARTARVTHVTARYGRRV